MKVAIAGAGGRMGRSLIEAVLADPGLTLAAAFDVPGSAAVGEQVADGLGSLPVEGVDGFLWLSADGSTRITKQAYTVRQGGGFYQVAEGAEVLVPMTHGWASGLEDHFIAKGDTGLLLHPAIAWDVFHHFLDKPLAGYEMAAKH